VYNETNQKHRSIFYYHSGGGMEIDFVIETKKKIGNQPPHVVLIEVKSADKWNPKWERPMRSLNALSGVHVDRMIGVYWGDRAYHFENFDVLPVTDFLHELHSAAIF
jgi:hypothetical protein